MRPRIRQVELSPTLRCPEDCGGCPDRASLHLQAPREQQLPIEDWFAITERLVSEYGAEYFLFIGGTIDRHPHTPELIRHILGMPEPADVGWFTDGIMLLDARSGQLTPTWEKLHKQAKLLEITTHVSADYLVPQGIRGEGPVLDPGSRWQSQSGGSRYYKSAFGLRLARLLVGKGAKRVIVNTTIQAHNLQEVLKIYQYVADLQELARGIGSRTVVLHSLSPWAWRPHLARGDHPGNYDASTALTAEHRPQLEAISKYILEDTLHRDTQGIPRVTAQSSGYLRGLPEFSITQDVRYESGSGQLAVQPDGTVRVEPLFTSARMLEFARNPYGYRDRDIDCNPFDCYADELENHNFPNLVQSTRGSSTWR